MSENKTWQYGARFPLKDEPRACFCVGPQNGEPLCPCQMRNVIIRNGRYIKKEIDLGPAFTVGDKLWSPK